MHEMSVELGKGIRYYRKNFYFPFVLLDCLIILQIFYFMVTFLIRKILLGNLNEAIPLFKIASFRYPWVF